MKAETDRERRCSSSRQTVWKNSSVEYSLDQVKQLIERQKERDHWEFLFLGANIDAVQTAAVWESGRAGL